MSSAYDEVIGGGLKLKGSSSLKTVSDGKVQKKKKNKSKKEENEDRRSSSPMVSRQDALRETSASPSSVASSSSGRAGRTELPEVAKTPAQMAFQKAQRKRLKDKISTMASKSHKEKVDDFNRYLESLSEHYDIPKVGPG